MVNNSVLCIYLSVYYTFVYIVVAPNKVLILEYTYEVSFFRDFLSFVWEYHTLRKDNSVWQFIK